MKFVSDAYAVHVQCVQITVYHIHVLAVCHNSDIADFDRFQDLTDDKTCPHIASVKSPPLALALI